MTANLPTSWAPLDTAIAAVLTDARLQFHYAAQFASAIAISWLEPLPDDSHTNLGWDPLHEALCSREVGARSQGVRLAVRPRTMSLLVLNDQSAAQHIPLHGSTIDEVEALLRRSLAAAGLDGGRFTVPRNSDLPFHPLSTGAAFDSSATRHFGELAHWYSNALLVLEELRARVGSSEVRCWPHHFDIATLATLGPGRSSGVGLSPGDSSYQEPYVYVNAYPQPAAGLAIAQLAGGGSWHTEGWIGAVLPASRLAADPASQLAQTRAFLESAFDACSRLATG